MASQAPAPSPASKQIRKPRLNLEAYLVRAELMMEKCEKGDRYGNIDDGIMHVKMAAALVEFGLAKGDQASRVEKCSEGLRRLEMLARGLNPDAAADAQPSPPKAKKRRSPRKKKGGQKTPSPPKNKAPSPKKPATRSRKAKALGDGKKMIQHRLFDSVDPVGPESSPNGDEESLEEDHNINDDVSSTPGSDVEAYVPGSTYPGEGTSDAVPEHPQGAPPPPVVPVSVLGPPPSVL